MQRLLVAAAATTVLTIALTTAALATITAPPTATVLGLAPPVHTAPMATRPTAPMAAGARASPFRSDHTASLTGDLLRRAGGAQVPVRAQRQA